MGKFTIIPNNLCKFSTLRASSLEANFKDVDKIFAQDSKQILSSLLNKLSGIKDWNSENIHEAIEEVMSTYNVGMGEVAKPLRLAITGRSNSPSIDKTSALLGKEKVTSRIKEVLEFFL